MTFAKGLYRSKKPGLHCLPPPGYCHGSEWLMGSETRAGDCPVMAAERPWVCCTLCQSCIWFSCVYKEQCINISKHRVNARWIYTRLKKMFFAVKSLMDVVQIHRRTFVCVVSVSVEVGCTLKLHVHGGFT